jgi:hypothetical protein
MHIFVETFPKTVGENPKQPKLVKSGLMVKND